MPIKVVLRIALTILLLGSKNLIAQTETRGQTGTPQARISLNDGWFLKSTALVEDGGEVVSIGRFAPESWHPTSVPSTVLNTLVKNKIYPDPRVGLDCYRIPDSSSEFNEENDLAKFSHLPDKRNPWRDPYWYRKEFTLPQQSKGHRTWLHFDCINYRAEVWLNGQRIAEPDEMVGMFQRFDFDVTSHAKSGKNVLAVKIFPVDHPAKPDKQSTPFSREQGFFKELMRDVTMVMSIGYDCMPTVPDRNMGIIQDVWLYQTGPVDIRHPFVVTELPLPKTDRATLRISAEAVNATDAPVQGVLRGKVVETEVQFEQPVTLAAHETKEIQVDSPLIMKNPKLWWPRGYGDQPLYDLSIAFEVDGVTSDAKISDEETVRFGVRQVTTELHKYAHPKEALASPKVGYGKVKQLDGPSHGRRILVNGRRIFCRGGFVQPEILFDWDAEWMDTEMRYFAEANLNLIYFEDIPNPPTAWLEACDRHGIMFGECFYANGWLRSGTNRPDDLGLLMRCTADMIKRYRNHPSLVMYMPHNEYDTRGDVYEAWREMIIKLDGTRFWIPSGSFPDTGTPAWISRKIPECIKADLPSGMNDMPGTYSWAEPSHYFDWVKKDGSWMFKMESGAPSVPPMSSLAKFIPDLLAPCERFVPDGVWSHHDACHYFKEYHNALQRLHGEGENAVDYAWKAHLVTADQHRSMFEAVNHRMWEITSGFTQWKINACWPSVEWQIFDWYLKPMISYYFIKKASEPLHVQLNLSDHKVSVINTLKTPQPNLKVRARVFDTTSKLLWEKTAQLDAPADGYQESFPMPDPSGVTPVYFVKLELKNSRDQLVSSSFYWLRSKGIEDLKSLQSLPMTKVEATCCIEKHGHGAENVARIKITNPTDRIAFFVQLALTDQQSGAEILPVFWDDNYFSLLPGETRELTARFYKKNAGKSSPTLEVGGWNVETNFNCSALTTSTKEVKSNTPFTVSARITNTFLDGSRIALYVDGKVVDSKMAWTRGNQGCNVNFTLMLASQGSHQIKVGSLTTSVLVK